MGRRGPVAKSGGDRQGHRARPTGAAVIPLSVDADKPQPVPRAPAGLSKALAEAWRDYWRSDVAVVERKEQVPAIRRLFVLRQRFEDAIAAAGLTTEGSQGQVVRDPVGEHALALAAQVLKLEVELGLTPMARARLGLVVGKSALTVEALNRMADPNPDDVIDVEAEDDPELAEWSPA
jgi:P27 family predicted phage terminase small subunit